jgi:hypothetical protein
MNWPDLSMPSARQPRTLHLSANRTVPVEFSTATSLKKFFGGKAEGRTPLNGHPGQSAGLVVRNFPLMRAGSFLGTAKQAGVSCQGNRDIRHICMTNRMMSEIARGC